MSSNDRPIGVFDSGVGGLTVLAEIRRRLTGEDTLYLGDTARVPYGTRSPETVRRYALNATTTLVERGVKALVVACNTATAHALPTLREHWPDLPIVGVIEPGAEAAADRAASDDIVVLTTEGTARSGAYEAAITRRRPTARVTAIPCPLFVALVEEGWASHGVTDAIVRTYLDGVGAPGCVLLGCTHFPPLRERIAEVVGEVPIVDSASTTAQRLDEELDAGRLRRDGPAGEAHYLATDGIERFCRIAPYFTGEALDHARVELVDLSGTA